MSEIYIFIRRTFLFLLIIPFITKYYDILSLETVSRPSKKSPISLIYSILKKANVVSNQPSLFVALSVKHGFL